MNNRRKGIDFEQWVARQVSKACPGFDSHRGQQARKGSDDPDVLAPDPFWLECKRGRRTNICAALRQAIAASPEGAVPVAICRNDREEATATLRLSDFLPLLRMAWEASRG